MPIVPNSPKQPQLDSDGLSTLDTPTLLTAQATLDLLKAGTDGKQQREWKRMPTVFRGIQDHEIRSLLTTAPYGIRKYPHEAILACPKRYRKYLSVGGVGKWPADTKITDTRVNLGSDKEHTVSIIVEGAIGILAFATRPWASREVSDNTSLENKREAKKEQEFEPYYGLILTQGEIFNEMKFLAQGHRGDRDRSNVLAFTMAPTTLLHIPFSSLALMTDHSSALRRNLTLCALEKNAIWHRAQRQATPGDDFERWSSTYLRLLSRYGTFGFLADAELPEYDRLCCRLDLFLPHYLACALTGDFSNKGNRGKMVKAWEPKKTPETFRPDLPAREWSGAHKPKWYRVSHILPEKVANRLLTALGHPEWRKKLRACMDGAPFQDTEFEKALTKTLRCASYALVADDEFPSDVESVYASITAPRRGGGPGAMNKLWIELKEARGNPRPAVKAKAPAS